MKAPSITIIHKHSLRERERRRYKDRDRKKERSRETGKDRVKKKREREKGGEQTDRQKGTKVCCCSHNVACKESFDFFQRRIYRRVNNFLHKRKKFSPSVGRVLMIRTRFRRRRRVRPFTVSFRKRTAKAGTLLCYRLLRSYALHCEPRA